MPLRSGAGTAGITFHVLNRGVRRLRLFEQDGDYGAFLRCLAETRARLSIELFAYCVMPNHFHLVVRPREDGQLGEFMRLLTVTHSKRWHAYRGTAGTGAVYQGRYKAFPVQTDRYFIALCRYVEGNPLRAGLVSRAQDWPWSSLSLDLPHAVDTWPIGRPAEWTDMVNQMGSRQEVERLRNAVAKGAPLGEPIWAERTAQTLGIERSRRRSGRPAKTTSGVVLRNT